MSEPSDEQAAMQHYLVCGTEDCQKNGQFNCNACHRPLCEQCRDQHQKSPNTKNHEINCPLPTSQTPASYGIMPRSSNPK